MDAVRAVRSVTAFDAAANSSADSRVWITTATPVTDTTAPKVPSSLKAPVISTMQVALSWVASTDTVGVEAYEIYSSTSTTGTLAEVVYDALGPAAGEHGRATERLASAAVTTTVAPGATLVLMNSP